MRGVPYQTDRVSRRGAKKNMARQDKVITRKAIAQLRQVEKHKRIKNGNEKRGKKSPAEHLEGSLNRLTVSQRKNRELGVRKKQRKRTFPKVHA